MSSEHPAYVVGVPIFGQLHTVIRCLESIFQWTPTRIQIILLDDGGPENNLGESLLNLLESSNRDFIWASHLMNRGFPSASNAIFDMAKNADVILVNSDVIVGAGWAEELASEAQQSRSTATITATTNYGSLAAIGAVDQICSIEGILDVRPDMPDVKSTRLVGLPTCVGHCVYFRRAALDLAGGFDESFGLGYGEEVDFSIRASRLGFSHLLSTGVVVFHEGSKSFAAVPEAEAIRQHNDARVFNQHPWFLGAVEDAERSQILQGVESPRLTGMRLEIARRSGVHIGLDCRMAGTTHTGTGRLVLELAVGVAQDERVRALTLFVSKGSLNFWLEIIGQKSLTNVELRVADESSTAVSHMCDVFLRPTQFYRAPEMALALSAASRNCLVILDAIAYGQNGYFASAQDWLGYRRLFEKSLMLSDQVCAISDFVADTLMQIGAVREVLTIPLGVDHFVLKDKVRVSSDSMKIKLIQYGAAFHHKNRRFSVAIAEELAFRGYSVQLLLVGPEPLYGSSSTADQQFVEDARQRVSAHSTGGTLDVLTLPYVSDRELARKIEESDLVLYPSVVEGFGFVPFESARLGTACLAASTGSLVDLLPGIARVEGFNVLAWADRIEDVHKFDHDEIVDAIRSASEEHTWKNSAKCAVDACLDALSRPQAAHLRVNYLTSSAEHECITIDQVSVIQPRDAGAEFSYQFAQLLAKESESEAELRSIYSSRRWRYISLLATWMGR